MLGNLVGIRCGASILLHPPDILGSFVDGSTSRGLLQGGVPGIPEGDTGGPSIPPKIQCSGGISS